MVKRYTAYGNEKHKDGPHNHARALFAQYNPDKRIVSVVVDEAAFIINGWREYIVTVEESCAST